MLRAFSGATSRRANSSGSTKWQILRNQYRRMTQAIRFGDLSEAESAFEAIRFEQSDGGVLSSDAQLAFEALGEAIDSGSLADATDGLRLLRLVLESSRESPSQRPSGVTSPSDEYPSPTLRSGFIPGHGSPSYDELPETATIQNISIGR